MSSKWKIFRIKVPGFALLELLLVVIVTSVLMSSVYLIYQKSSETTFKTYYGILLQDGHTNYKDDYVEINNNDVNVLKKYAGCNTDAMKRIIEEIISE